MVAMVVSRNQVIDLFEAGISDGGHDAIRVAHRRRASIPRIDENRFAGGRNIKLGVASLHIDHVDVQRLCNSSLAHEQRRRKGEHQHRH